jgi:hypothetical protein
VNFVDRLYSLRQAAGYGDKAPEVFYLFQTLPSSAGGGQMGLGIRVKPFRVPVRFASAADIPVPGPDEIDGAPRFVGPVFSR